MAGIHAFAMESLPYFYEQAWDLWHPRFFHKSSESDSIAKAWIPAIRLARGQKLFLFPQSVAKQKKKSRTFLQRTALAEITEVLLNIGEISGVQVFIDGTKMESAADWYTFVWKKAVTKFQNRLAERRAVFVEGLELSYGIRGNFINLFPYYIYLSSWQHHGDNIRISHNLLSPSPSLSQKLLNSSTWSQNTEKRNNTMSQMRLRSVIKMQTSILITATTEQMGYGIVSFFVYSALQIRIIYSVF